MNRRGATLWATGVLGLVLVGMAGVAMHRYDATRGAGKAAKDVVGAVEGVTLVGWGLTVPARVDTGAASSSLDAREVKVVGHDEVEFSLPERLGGRRVRCRPVAWQTVRSSDGGAERRPMVELDIVLGARRLRTRFTLNDRSHMDYPMLIGRNTLEGRFLVDVATGKPAEPVAEGGGGASGR